MRSGNLSLVSHFGMQRRTGKADFWCVQFTLGDDSRQIRDAQGCESGLFEAWLSEMLFLLSLVSARASVRT